MKKMFIFFCFSIFFLSGAGVLYTIGWPTYAENRMYPSPSFFILTLLFCCVIYNSKSFAKYKFELWGMLLLFLLILFNKLTGRNVDIRAVVTGLFTPFMFSIIVRDIGGGIDRDKIRSVFVAFLVINSLIAIYEQITHSYVLGLTEELGGNDYGFRSHALMGHPLSNSGYVSIIMIFILISSYSLKKRVLLWILGFVSILCFNSRLAMVISILFLFIWGMKEFLFSKDKKKITPSYLLALIFISVIVYMAFTSGYGDRLLQMGLIDDSSAAARIQIWTIFDYVDWKSLYLGISLKQQDVIMMRSGTDELIIENCWIIFVLTYGYIITAVMIVYFSFLFKRFLSNYSRWNSLFVILPWLLSISSSNSIASGGLNITVTLLLLFAFAPDKINVYDT